MQNILVKISELISEFEGQEIKIADYVIKNPQEASSLTITELADKVKVSPATITRFCSHLGYKGYRELSKDLFLSASKQSSSVNILYDVKNEISEDMSIHDIIDAVTKLNVQSIVKTQELLDEEQLKGAIKLLDFSSSIVVFATSGSVAVAEDAVFKFNRLGLKCSLYSYPHDQILAATKLEKNDVGLFISYSGENRELINALKIMKERKVPSIAITKYGKNAISKLADFNIQHSYYGKDNKTYSTRSRTVQENVLDILFIALRQLRDDHLQQYYKLFDRK